MNRVRNTVRVEKMVDIRMKTFSSECQEETFIRNDIEAESMHSLMHFLRNNGFLIYTFC